MRAGGKIRGSRDATLQIGKLCAFVDVWVVAPKVAGAEIGASYRRRRPMRLHTVCTDRGPTCILYSAPSGPPQWSLLYRRVAFISAAHFDCGELTFFVHMMRSIHPCYAVNMTVHTTHVATRGTTTLDVSEAAAFLQTVAGMRPHLRYRISLPFARSRQTDAIEGICRGHASSSLDGPEGPQE